MRSSHKIAMVLSCGFLLCFGAVNNPASAIDQTSVGPCEGTTLKAEQDVRKDSHLIQGEVLRVEGSTYFVKGQDGKEVSLQTDQTTDMPDITQGDQIEANMNDQNHALWIRSGKSTDRRNEHAAVDCMPN